VIRRYGGGPALVLGLAAGLVLGGCSEDDPGPGVIEVVVGAEVPVGGVVVELVGDGILGLQSRAGVTAALQTRTVSGAQPEVRIVAIQEVAGPLILQLDVARSGSALPTARVVQASSGDDVLLPAYALPDIQVRRVR
jgi:hypothetical protein